MFNTLISIGAVTPDIQSDKGNAWKSLYDFPEHVLSSWIVHAPKYSDEWSCYFLLMMRLRNKKGKLTDTLVFPHASHQIIVFPILPSEPVFLNTFPKYVTPPTFSAQWFCREDKHATDMLDKVVLAVCNGFMDPTAEDKDEWIMLFGASSIPADRNDYSYILTKDDFH